MVFRPTNRALMLSALAGALYWAAQPPLALGVLAFVALVPVLVAVRDARPARGHVARGYVARGHVARGFVCGWLAGTIACNGLTSASIFTALVRGGHPAWLAAVEAAVVPQLCGALYFGLFGAAGAALGRRPAALAVLPAAWVATELARARVGHGMPWVLLAHAVVGWPRLVQVADLGGAYAVSFLVALVNVALANLRRRTVAVAATVVLVALGYGQARLHAADPAGAARLRVALVQGDVPESWRSTLAGVPQTVARYRELVAEASRTHPDLVILPENAVSVSVPANRQVLADVARPLAGGDALLLVGGPRDVALAHGRASIRNSAHLVDATGATRAVYDKRHLVPFGEASTWLVPGPLRRRLGLRDDYSAGDAAAPFDVAGVRLATLICWEGIYAGPTAALVRDGAQVLVNLSNDDWFGGHAATEQHFRATVLRAVETRRPLVRVTNSGVTAVVDARGTVVAAAPRAVPAVVPATVVAGSGLTLYARVGDAFAWACASAALLALAAGRRARR